MQAHLIALLVNPLASRKIVAKIIAAITVSLTRKKIAFQLFTNEWPTDINTYQEAWIIGGDGTLNYFLNAYPNIIIPIAIFKGGTGNDFATRLYGKPSLFRQIEIVLSAEPKYVDAAACNGRKYMNGVGIGFDGEVLKSMNAIRLLGGHLGYLLVVVQQIFSFKEMDFKLQYDDTTYSKKALLLLVMNSSTTGGGFHVSPQAKINDGQLDMIICKPLSILNRLKYLPVIQKGKHLGKPFILHKRISTIKIDCEKETLAQIDGELISAKSFEIKVLHNHCRFKY